MKFRFSVFWLLFGALLVFSQSQNYVSGSISAGDPGTCATAGSCVGAQLDQNAATAIVTVQNSFSGTLQFEIVSGTKNINSSNFTSVACYETASPSVFITSTTQAIQVSCPVAAQSMIRVRGASGWVSGTAGIQIQVSDSSARVSPTGPTGATGATGATGSVNAFTGQALGTGSNCATPAYSFGAHSGTGFDNSGSANDLLFCTGTNREAQLRNGGPFALAGSIAVGFTSTGDAAGTVDSWISRKAAGYIGIGATSNGIDGRLDTGNVNAAIGVHTPNSAVFNQVNSTFYMDGTTYALNATGLQAAINAASALVQGTVRVGLTGVPGIDLNTTTITLPANVCVIGDGTTASVITYRGTGAAIQMQYTAGACIEHLTIRMAGASGAASAISIVANSGGGQNVYRNVFSDLLITSTAEVTGQTGISVSSTALAQVFANSFDKITFNSIDLPYVSNNEEGNQFNNINIVAFGATGISVNGNDDQFTSVHVYGGPNVTSGSYAMVETGQINTVNIVTDCMPCNAINDTGGLNTILLVALNPRGPVAVSSNIQTLTATGGAAGGATGNITDQLTAPYTQLNTGAAGNNYAISATNGGSNSSGTGGNGGNLTYTAGNGGSGSTSSNGGNGGFIYLTPGAGAGSNGLPGYVVLGGSTASQAVFTDAGKNLVSKAVTGTGSVVLGTSPTLVTPALGTPQSGVMTNMTGLTPAGFLVNGMPLFGGTAPTMGTCGSSPSIAGSGASAAATNNAFTVTIGGGTVTSCTVNFGQNFTNAPSCTVSDNSTTIVPDISAVSGSAITFSFASSLGGGKLYVTCF